MKRRFIGWLEGEEMVAVLLEAPVERREALVAKLAEKHKTSKANVRRIAAHHKVQGVARC